MPALLDGGVGRRYRMLSWAMAHPLEVACLILLAVGSSIVAYLVWLASQPLDWDDYWGEDDE